MSESFFLLSKASSPMTTRKSIDKVAKLLELLDKHIFGREKFSYPSLSREMLSY
jgi:hypothetical protein